MIVRLVVLLNNCIILPDFILLELHHLVYKCLHDSYSQIIVLAFGFVVYYAEVFMDGYQEL